MGKDLFTDAEVEHEIAELLASAEVKLAKKETQIRCKRRQYMYSLRTMKRRGQQLMKEGYTIDNIEQRLLGGTRQ